MNDDIMKRPKPLVLVILDGWGIGPPYQGNALSNADTPFLDSLLAEYPSMPLVASGDEIGLGWNEPGHCTSGYRAIGTGRPAVNLLHAVNREIASNRFYKNKRLAALMDGVAARGKKLHLCGIVSNGSVHGSIDHLHALLVMAKERRVPDVCIHAVSDGVETQPNSGLMFIRGIERSMREYGVGRLASVSGRFYAMDRGGFWDRTARFYDALVGGSAAVRPGAEEAIAESYEKMIFDEEFPPTAIGGAASGFLEPGDAIIFFNVRSDGTRQIQEALFSEDFERFPRRSKSDVESVSFHDLFGPHSGTSSEEGCASSGLPAILSRQGLKSLAITETERYGRMRMDFCDERDGSSCEIEVVASPQADDYSAIPEMSAKRITEEAVKAVSRGAHDFIVASFANADEVALAGDASSVSLSAAIIDKQLSLLAKAIQDAGGVMMITADHGNGERMLDMQADTVDSMRTANPVPFILVGEGYRGRNLGWQDVAGGDLSLVKPQGSLLDVAPTILSILGIEKPGYMPGRSLF